VQFDVQTVALGAISVESSPITGPSSRRAPHSTAIRNFLEGAKERWGGAPSWIRTSGLQLRRLKTGGSLSSQLKENRTGDLLKSPQKISRKSLKNREAIRAN